MTTPRQLRKQNYREIHEYIKTLPKTLEEVPAHEIPVHPRAPKRAWRSRKWVVQLFSDPTPDYPDLLRLSVCRAVVNKDGAFEQNITWDELQAIKREVGYGDWYAVEVYPPDSQVVNVTNMRHLFLLEKPLQIGWFKAEAG